ncbi:glycosyltransferase family 2 protein [Photobacterium damselae subsp. damselae]|uniref:glycosyltransferase family 2 protein n=1 Tax=Photobacterium damselae TaxID=38293 RepID=UPI001F16A7BD|nr:glycosyltransferase family 2 protein [Photobacterium damselae]UKA06988.1 glycosyltransferase family 2 protein [Photobacterium damselae subsp. damselae]UKA22093.1 glycosyltransferase family 2 protein [Photobacterium damselae subsp. damselae]
MILIPMAGLSSRFAKAGYAQPKFMLEAHGETLFEHSIKSFSRYFDIQDFVFVCSNENSIVNFVENKIAVLGIKHSLIVTVDHPTRGQAETVYIGLKKYLLSKNVQANRLNLTIFNIDTFRSNFEFPNLETMGDGYLEVFEGEGSNWSFARPENDESTVVVETAEKKAISNLCSTGLYYFRNSEDYILSFEQYITLPQILWEKGELYIAPLYNYLIKSGRQVHYNKIPRESVIFCGIPEEYLQFLSSRHI